MDGVALFLDEPGLREPRQRLQEVALQRTAELLLVAWTRQGPAVSQGQGEESQFPLVIGEREGFLDRAVPALDALQVGLEASR